MGRMLHRINIDDWGLVQLIFYADDLLVVVICAIVPLALEFGQFDVGFIGPSTTDFEFCELILALNKIDVERSLIKGFHSLGLIFLFIDFRFEFVLQRGHYNYQIINVPVHQKKLSLSDQYKKVYNRGKSI
jgi:hypothetical protein